MAKTELTKQLERSMFRIAKQNGVFGCFEVTIGWFGNERVDYLTYDYKGIWRCYEIKVSKSDFYSKAKKTFIGHYNYFVLPHELYEQVKDDIPPNVGVYTDYCCVKRAKKQGLAVDEQILKDSMIRSLARESNKLFESSNPDTIQGYKRRIKKLEDELFQSRQSYEELYRIGRKKYGRNWHYEEESK